MNAGKPEIEERFSDLTKIIKALRCFLALPRALLVCACAPPRPQRPLGRCFVVQARLLFN